MFLTPQKTYLYSETEVDRLGRPKRIAASTHMVPEGHKRCGKCQVVKEVASFSRRRRGGDALHSYCKDCNRSAMREWNYGLSHDEYQNILDRQGGVCAICSEPDRKLVIDHDHQTGTVRGLLCADCNIGLGRFRDTPAYLQAAVAYLGGASSF